MKVELMVDGLTVAEFNGTLAGALSFQASTFRYLSEAQSESANAHNKRSRNAFAKLNEIQFGIIKKDPKGPR